MPPEEFRKYLNDHKESAERGGRMMPAELAKRMLETGGSQGKVPTVGHLPSTTSTGRLRGPVECAGRRLPVHTVRRPRALARRHAEAHPHGRFTDVTVLFWFRPHPSFA
jgi:hypothetical protein